MANSIPTKLPAKTRTIEIRNPSNPASMYVLFVADTWTHTDEIVIGDNKGQMIALSVENAEELARNIQAIAEDVRLTRGH